MTNSSDSIYKYQPLFGSWNIEEEIGEGSFGTVYLVSKEQLGQKYISAVKLITIPSKEQYREAKSTLGTDVNTLHNYFQDIVENIIKEVNILHSLSGNNNILNYHDHNVVERDDKIGWDILIRMEYVSSLPKYLEAHSLSREQVIRLGIDICTALEVCSKKGIIHRDIKDENIFVNEDEVFKLGDFGIARELSGSGRAASMRGTPLYMAPEVYRGEKYDPTVDIYSLGIVLYKLLNNGRMPFMPPTSEVIKYKDSERALDRRMFGEDLPNPANAKEELGRVVLKACAFNAEDRYTSAGEMKKSLETVLLQLNPDLRSEVTVIPLSWQMTQPSKEEDYKEPQGTIGMFDSARFVGVDYASDMPLVDQTMSMFNGLENSPESGRIDFFVEKEETQVKEIDPMYSSQNNLSLNVKKTICAEDTKKTEPFQSSNKSPDTLIPFEDSILSQNFNIICAFIVILIALSGVIVFYSAADIFRVQGTSFFLGGSALIFNGESTIVAFDGKFYIIIGYIMLTLGCFSTAFSLKARMATNIDDAHKNLKISKILNMITLVPAMNVLFTAIQIGILINR